MPVTFTETLSPAEHLKIASRGLRGTLAAEVGNGDPAFSKDSATLLKFHGAYQGDDRDLRKSGAKVYSVMVRLSIPGGRVTAAQYLCLDRLADSAGDGTLRITSRQDIQYHHVRKRSLSGLIRAISSAGLTTLAACGDVVRNVICCAAPVAGADRDELWRHARQLDRVLKPHTRAYAEIWLDGELAASLEPAAEDIEPLYGAAYLPRKFKIGFAAEGENTTDVYANDLGFVAHNDGGSLAGFTVLAGGGLGVSAGVKASHPRLADPVGFVEPGEVVPLAAAVVSIHRDYGNRSNRKLARLKYVIEERGLEWFKAELESRLGNPLAPPRALDWRRHADYLGWHRQAGGGWFFGLRVISGRLAGAQRQAVREAVETLRPEVRFTVQQNLLLCGLSDADRARFEHILNRHGVPLPGALPPVLRHSMACPALPTCGLAITESERVLPEMVAAVQSELDAVGLGAETIHLRQTGCPNGCARPYTAEIGIVGQSVGMYTVYLGGSPLATRLGQVYRDRVPLASIAALLRPVFAEFAASRQPGEAFGDYCHRVGVENLRARHAEA